MIIEIKGKRYKLHVTEWMKFAVYSGIMGGMMYVLFGIYAAAEGHPIW